MIIFKVDSHHDAAELVKKFNLTIGDKVCVVAPCFRESKMALEIANASINLHMRRDVDRLELNAKDVGRFFAVPVGDGRVCEKYGPPSHLIIIDENRIPGEVLAALTGKAVAKPISAAACETGYLQHVALVTHRYRHVVEGAGSQRSEFEIETQTADDLVKLVKALI